MNPSRICDRTLGLRIIIVGTGTDVGKTHVAMGLLAHLVSRGVRVKSYKPVATGVVGHGEDAERHAIASGAESLPSTFAYRLGVSPHLAARVENRPIELDAIALEARAREAQNDVLVIEGAGGLFSPLGEAITNADLVLALMPAKVVLVAADRLGVLHDVRACILASATLGVTISTLALSAPSTPDASTGTNAAELERLGLGPVGAVFPRGPYDDFGGQAASLALTTALAIESRR